MKILLVGKTGVFDTLAVASGCLNQMDISNSPYFADLRLENSKKLVKIGSDKRGNEIFVVGFRAPEILPTIQQQLESLSKINEKDRLQVIPISVEGENITWLLSKLANLPLIGTLFLNWAKSRTLNRSPYLIEFGKNLHMEKNIDAKDKAELMFAAKPLRKGKQTLK